MRPVPISEIFGPTVQGEGLLAGMRTMFVRTAYCDGAGENGWCTWCDSLHSVDPKGFQLAQSPNNRHLSMIRPNKYYWSWLDEHAILANLKKLSADCKAVTISGGNPALHDLWDLVNLLHENGYKVYVETQGTVYKQWLNFCDVVTVSPKPPSAGSTLNKEKLDSFLEQVQDPAVHPNRSDSLVTAAVLVMKVVVDPDLPTDYSFARGLAQEYAPRMDAFYMSCLTKPTDTTEDLIARWRRLVDLSVEDESGLMDNVGVLSQLHVLLWEHELGV